MATSNARGDQDTSHVRSDVQQASEQLQRAMPSPRVVTSARQPAVSGSTVCDSGSTNRRPDSERAADASISSVVQQMDTLTISDKQQEVSPPGRCGVHSRSQGHKRRRVLRGQAAAGSKPGVVRCDGQTQPKDGWRCVYDAVTSLSPQKVIQSVVKQCSSEWYQLGIELGFSDNEIEAMTFNIPTPAGKLRVIVEKKAMAHGKGKIVEALLDLCEQILPLATVAVMEELGIKYTVPDHLLYEMGKEVGRDWKKVARYLGLTSQDMDSIKKKAKSSRERAWKMLQLWHSRRDLSVYEIHRKSQIFPENVHIDQRVCGRRREMEGIAQGFWGQTDDKETPTQIPKYCLQVVNGMGGIGKSAVSEKYATEWKKKYGDGVFHFNAESLAALHMSIRGNLRSLSLEPAKGGVFEDNKIFLQYVYSKGNVLLLYDGADDLDLLENILPRDTAHIHILVTTRTRGDHPILERVDGVTRLGRLTPDAGVEALQAWRGHIGEELDGEELMFAKRVVSESPIEGLPLAIAHIGTCIKKGRISCQQYYCLFKKEQSVLQALALDMNKLLHYFRISNLREPLERQGLFQPKDLSRISVEDIQSIAVEQNDRHLLSLARHFVMNSNPVHLTWQLDIELLKKTDRNALNVLLYASLMASRNIPERVLRPLVFCDSSYQYNLHVDTLMSHTLVDVSENNEGYSLHMHPLVQATLLERVMQQPEELRGRLNKITYILLRLLPFSDGDIQSCLKEDQFLSLLSHTYAVASKAVWIRDDVTCDCLVEVACRIALMTQHIDVAIYLCQERLKGTGTSLNNWQRLTALYEMGQAFDLMANPQSAQLHFMEALRLIESSSDHEKMRMEYLYGVVLGRLAACYSDQEMFIEAEDIYQKELQLVKKRSRHEDNRKDIAAVLNNLAVNYDKSGQLEKAIKAYENVVEMHTGDPETPPLSLSVSLANMGSCLMENGQFDRALLLLKRSLSINRENLPKGHLNLAPVITELSSCCLKLGDVQRAMQLAEEAVAIASNCLPINHPNTALYLSHLASCHESAGRLDAAIHLEQQCSEILRQNLPSTRSYLCSSNLGVYYSNKGMLEEATKTLEECLAAQRTFLPPNHPTIGHMLWNLGTAYEKANDDLRATELLRECLSIKENSLPSTHPDLTNVLGALGHIAMKQRRYDESLQMYGRARDILMRTSPKSQKMASVFHIMGVSYMLLSQLDAAEESFSKSLTII